MFELSINDFIYIDYQELSSFVLLAATQNIITLDQNKRFMNSHGFDNDEENNILGGSSNIYYNKYLKYKIKKLK